MSREHLATLNEFNYTYVKSLIQNGITDEDITSSEYLFSMYYYIKTRNGVLLYNLTSNDHYDTRNFYKKLENEIYRENSFIEKHSKPYNKHSIDTALEDENNFRDNLTQIIENIYIHQSNIKGFELLKSSLSAYLNKKKPRSLITT